VLIARDLSQRYRGAILGVLWSLALPLATLAMYTFVFSFVLQVSPWRTGGGEGAATNFALTMFAGLVPFQLFSEVLSRAPNVIVSVPSYVKRVIFPVEVLPVVAVGSAFVQSLVSLSVLIVMVVAVERKLSLAVLVLPLAYVPLLLLCLSVGWMLSSIGVYVRDLTHGVGVAGQFLFFATPIIYPVSAVPAWAEIFLRMNPLTVIIEVFRAALLGHPMPTPSALAVCTLGLALAAWGSYMWFMRVKRGFPEAL
jgi:lipopolysaccharide transport system permease protein